MMGYLFAEIMKEAGLPDGVQLRRELQLGAPAVAGAATQDGARP